MVADYDSAGDAYISPSGLNNTAKQLSDLAQSAVDAISRIDDTLKSLVLNDWMGKSQQEADDFNNRWLAVMHELFGTKDKPDDGVLNAISNGLGTAAHNYNKAEAGIVEMWSEFVAQLGNAGSPSDTPSDQLDTNKTAITADYPPFT